MINDSSYGDWHHVNNPRIDARVDDLCLGGTWVVLWRVDHKCQLGWAQVH